MESAAYEQLVLESFGLCILAFMVIVAFHLMSLHFAIHNHIWVLVFQYCHCFLHF